MGTVAIMLPLMQFIASSFKKERLIKSIVFIFFMCSHVIALLFFVGTIKMPSTYGRLLTLQVTRAHLYKNIWFGIGFGRFLVHYPYWQEQYFRTASVIPTHFLLNAGETYIILNIYFLLLSEIGVIGCLMLFVLPLCFFRYKAKCNQQLINMKKQVVLMILIAGLTSYPLNVSPTIFICLVCLFSVLMNNPISSYFTSLLFYLKKLYVAMFAVMLVFVFQMVRAVYSWQSMRSSNSYSHSELIQRYSALYPQMLNDYKYLTEYGEELLKESGSCKEAVFIFHNAIKKQITPRLVNNYAIACKCLGNYEEAIKNYRFLSYLLPS